MPETRPAPAAIGEAAPSDGYGTLLCEAYTAGPRPGTHLQVIERDDAYVSIEDAYRYFSRPDEWIAGERHAVAVAAGRVLDVGCGAGRHLRAITSRGHDALGIDPSPGAVAVAQAQGLNARVGTALNPGDIGRFDTILMLGGNLGLLGSRDQAPAVLDSLARLARPGARLLAIGHDHTKAATPEHRAYHERNRERGRMPGQVRMRVRYRSWASSWFDRLLLTPAELEELAAPSPWMLTEVTYSPNTAGFYLAGLKVRRTDA